MRPAGLLLLVALCLLALPATALELPPRWQVSQTAKILSSPTLWSHAGRRGVVVNDQSGQLALYDAQSKVLWSYRPPATRYQAAAAVADLDLDGHPETVALSSGGHVACLDLAGKLRWERRLGADSGWCAPLLADLEGDPRLEVALPDSAGRVTVLDCQGRLLWRFDVGAEIAAALGAGDLDGDGRTEMVVPAGDGSVYALGASGSCRWLHRGPGELYCAPVVADLEGDGRLEVLVGFDGGQVLCCDGPTGKLRWSTDIGSQVDAALSLADLDGDRRLEVLAGDRDFGMTCLDASGRIRWRAQRQARRPGETSVVSAAAVADVNGDGRPEVLYGHKEGCLVVLDAAGHALLELPVPGGMNSSPLVADLDRDGKLEVVVTGVQQVLCLGTGRPGRVQWDSFRNGGKLAGLLAPVGPLAHVRPLRPRGGGPALAFTGLHGGEAVVRVGPVAAPGLAWARVRRPDGIAYAAARRLPAGGCFDLSFCQSVSGRYLVQTALTSAGTCRTREVSVMLEPFQPHLLRSRQDLGAAAQAIASLPPESGLRDQLSLLRALADRLQAEAEAATGDQANALAPQAELLVRRAAHLGQVAGVLAGRQSTFPIAVWQANPWREFSELDLPAAGEAQGQLSLPPLYQGERRHLALNLLNHAGRVLGLRVEPGDLEGNGKSYPWRDRLELLVLRSVGCREGREVWDPLPRLGPDRLLELPNFQARQLWLVLDTTGLEPGSYRLPLTLTTTAQQPHELALTLELEVLPLPLAQGRQLRFCQWGYFFEPTNYLSHCQPQAVADMVRHGTNVFVIAGSAQPKASFTPEGDLAAPLDWSYHDQVVGLCHPHGILLYCGYQSALQGVPAGTPAWERAHATLVREYVRHLAELGLGYASFALYPVDEPGLSEGLAREYIRLARAIKAADPQVQVYTDPVTGMTLEELREAAPFTDIWCPHTSVIAEKPDCFSFLLSTGKPVWTYECNGPAKTLSPTRYYRGLSWLAWKRGLQGVGFWTYCTTQYHPWRGDEPDEGEYVLVYPGDTPVSSRRWEAAFAGLQDYAALDLLSQAIRQAEGRADPAQLAQARRALATAVAKVTALTRDDAGQAMDDARRQIADWTLKLQAAP